MSIFEQKELVSTVRHYSRRLISSREINKLCREVTSILNKTNARGLLETDLVDGLKKTGQLLWDHLFARAVKDKLKTSPLRDLILSLDEKLIHIPWELLYDGNYFLCLRFNLGRVIRTREKLPPCQYRSFSGKPRMLILANPTDDLKSAYLEGIFIKSQFDRKRKEIKIDFKSTYIDTLYVKKNLRDYDIVHFAGHCEQDLDNPRNSGWVLRDGRFTIRDIYALGETPSLPTLVFSNACHSAEVTRNPVASDYQEEIYSLATAFLFSGARLYIGTIRKIEDPVSLTFAREFYFCLISGRPVGECLRLSRMKLIKEYGITAISWAGYLFYGDPNFVLFNTEAKPSLAKNNLPLYKEPLRRLALLMPVIFVCIYLYIWLPATNPDTYALFLKSRNLFLKSKDREVILLFSRIIEKEPKFLAAYSLLGNTPQRSANKKDKVPAVRNFYTKSAVLFEKLKLKNKLSDCYFNLGKICLFEKQYQKALDYYLQGLKIDQLQENKLNIASDYNMIGKLYIEMDNLDEAERFFNQSILIAKQIDARPELADAYHNLGLLYKKKRQKNKAKAAFRYARKIYREIDEAASEN